MKVVTVIGARPQFVKAAVVSRAFRESGRVAEILVHTGQHYDARMSQIFFDELEIPAPAYNLQIGSGRHGEQTARMLARLEEVMIEETPDAVLVYGDTNSTLAGALAAAKLQIPIAHVEAGLRSFNRAMPEEVNRVLTDHAAALHFCPTEEAVANLAAEGITGGVHLVGDVMYDGAMRFSAIAESRVDPLHKLGVERRRYCLLTCHRAENTDDPRRLAGIVEAVNRVANERTILFPVHPRTRKLLEQSEVKLDPKVRQIEPASYLEMLLLERNAELILTDSGGVQKEAFFFGVPCVTLRDETEWKETVACGANLLAGADPEQITAAVEVQVRRCGTLPDASSYYGGRRAAARIADVVAEFDPKTDRRCGLSHGDSKEQHRAESA